MPQTNYHPFIFNTESKPGRPAGRPYGASPGSVGAIVAGFKSATTKKINAIRQTPGCSLWQRNYYEHIIRNETDLHRIREYIQTNPTRWELDSLYPTP
jgi:hypothetical protein